MSGSGPALWACVAIAVLAAPSTVVAQPPLDDRAPEEAAPQDVELRNPQTGDGLPDDPSATEALLSDVELGILADIRAAGPIEPATDRPCSFGVYGPPLNVRDPDLAVSGVEIFDPCGLRFTDLSGLWALSGSFQVIAYHERRGGGLSMRFTHIDPDNDYYRIWGYMFGDDWYRGLIAPDAVELLAIARYPESMREVCPDDWETPFPVHSIHLGYAPTGQVTITGSRIRNTLSPQCEMTYLDTVVDSFARVEPGVREWTD